MIFEGDTGVIDALKVKKRLMDAGEKHGHIRPLLFIDGGLMKGTYGAGAVVALEELGFTNVFDNAVGVSSGAPTVSYFVSGDARRGVSIYSEEACNRKFINPWRFWNQVDTFYFAATLRGVTNKGLDMAKMLAARTKVFIAVADFETGKPKLLQPTAGEELLQAIQASVLMPNVSTDIVKFKDIRYVDGGFTRPHALKKALEQIDATHVLVIANQDKTITTLPRLERFLNHTLYRRRMPKALRFAAHERKRERMKVIAEMEAGLHIPYALVWGDHSITSMERNPQKVMQVIEKSRRWWRELFDTADVIVERTH